MKNLVNNSLNGFGLTWWGLASKGLVSPQQESESPTYVWILSSDVVPQPPTKRGLWTADGVWIADNVWYA